MDRPTPSTSGSGSSSRAELPLPPVERVGRVVVAIGLSGALAAALAILLGSGQCTICDDAGSTLTAVMAFAGGLAYVTALALMAFPRTAWLGALLIALAAGTHLFLLKLMYDTGQACEWCMLAALGVWVALFGVVRLRISGPRLMFGSVLVGLVGTIAAAFGILHGGMLSQRTLASEEYQLALEEAGHLWVPERDYALIVVFERDGCAACRILTTDHDQRGLERELGMRVEVVRLQARPELPVPTVVVRNHEQALVFAGAPTRNQLLEALGAKR